VPGLLAEAVSGDGKTIAWATAAQIDFVRAADGSHPAEPLKIPHTRMVELNNEGSLLAVSSAKTPSLVVFDVASKNEIFRIEPESIVVKAVFSPDSRYLAASSSGNALTVIQLQKRSVLSALQGLDSRVLLFSHNGKFLAAGGGRDAPRVRADAPGGQFPFAINVIETATGNLLSTIQIAREAVAAAFSPDDRYLEVVDDTSITRHYLRTDDLIDQTCSLLTRNLLEVEWREFMARVPYRPTCPKQ
jgi:WD40 repeat protein